MKGFKPATFGSVFCSEDKRAIGGDNPEFLGQLGASLLVAEWLEPRCASLVAKVLFLACLV